MSIWVTRQLSLFYEATSNRRGHTQQMSDLPAECAALASHNGLQLHAAAAARCMKLDCNPFAAKLHASSNKYFPASSNQQLPCKVSQQQWPSCNILLQICRSLMKVIPSNQKRLWSVVISDNGEPPPPPPCSRIPPMMDAQSSQCRQSTARHG